MKRPDESKRVEKKWPEDKGLQTPPTARKEQPKPEKRRRGYDGLIDPDEDLSYLPPKDENRL